MSVSPTPVKRRPLHPLLQGLQVNEQQRTPQHLLQQLTRASPVSPKESVHPAKENAAPMPNLPSPFKSFLKSKTRSTPSSPAFLKRRSSTAIPTLSNTSSSETLHSIVNPSDASFNETSVFTTNDCIGQKQESKNVLFAATTTLNETEIMDSGNTSENSIELEENAQLYVEMSQMIQQFKFDLDDNHTILHKMEQEADENREIMQRYSAMEMEWKQKEQELLEQLCHAKEETLLAQKLVQEQQLENESLEETLSALEREIMKGTAKKNPERRVNNPGNAFFWLTLFIVLIQATFIYILLGFEVALPSNTPGTKITIYSVILPAVKGFTDTILLNKL